MLAPWMSHIMSGLEQEVIMWQQVRRAHVRNTSNTHPTLPEAFIMPLYPVSVALLGTRLLPIPQDVDSRGRVGFTRNSRFATSFKGHVGATSLLLENGPNSCDHLGRPPLQRVSQG